MANLKRYNCGNASGGMLFVESLDGEWVKFADVKEFLKPTTNKQSTPCPHAIMDQYEEGGPFKRWCKEFNWWC